MRVRLDVVIRGIRGNRILVVNWIFVVKSPDMNLVVEQFILILEITFFVLISRLLDWVQTGFSITYLAIVLFCVHHNGFEKTILFSAFRVMCARFNILCIHPCQFLAKLSILWD